MLIAGSFCRLGMNFVSMVDILARKLWTFWPLAAVRRVIF